MYATGLLQCDDLPSSLSWAILEMKERYPLLSSKSLAKRLDIPNATFDRIAKKEVKNPSFNHAVTIAQEACGRNSKEIQKFIGKFYPEMAPILANWSSLYDGDEEAFFLDERMDKHMGDPINYEIFMLVTSKAGISEKEVLSEYGRRGLEVIKQLQEDELLEKREGRYYADGSFNSTQKTVWKFSQNLLKKNYKLDDFGTGKNWLSVQWQSINPDYVVPRIKEVFIKTRQKINEILDAPEAAGDQVIWTSMVMDSLTKHNLNEQKETP